MKVDLKTRIENQHNLIAELREQLENAYARLEDLINEEKLEENSKLLLEKSK